MQLSPATVDEGLAYLQMMFQTMATTQDTIRRLFIVAAASYDDFLRKNISRLESNPYTDLLYFETETPLEGKGSTFYMPYYGAMYEAGNITPVEATDVLLVGANPLVKTVTDAMQGYTDGFQTSLIVTDGQPEKNLVTAWLSDKVSGGFTVADTTAIQLLTNWQWQSDRHLLVPICGGSASNFRRLIELFGFYDFVGIDCVAVSAHCNFSVVKHVDRAVLRCIEQWLSSEGMPKHQTFGLADGYTGVSNTVTIICSPYVPSPTPDPTPGVQTDTAVISADRYSVPSGGTVVFSVNTDLDPVYYMWYVQYEGSSVLENPVITVMNTCPMVFTKSARVYCTVAGYGGMVATSNIVDITVS